VEARQIPPTLIPSLRADYPRISRCRRRASGATRWCGQRGLRTWHESFLRAAPQSLCEKNPPRPSRRRRCLSRRCVIDAPGRLDIVRRWGEKTDGLLRTRRVAWRVSVVRESTTLPRVNQLRLRRSPCPRERCGENLFPDECERALITTGNRNHPWS
jgi:hypothetical protein